MGLVVIHRRHPVGGRAPWHAALLGSLAACTLGDYRGPTPQLADGRVEIPTVTLDVASQEAPALALGMLPVMPEDAGPVHALLQQAAARHDAGIGRVLAESQAVVDEARGRREDRRDGPDLVFGGFDDPLGRDATWWLRIRRARGFVRIEVRVAEGDAGTLAADDPNGDAAPLVLEGAVAVDADAAADAVARRGTWTLWPQALAEALGPVEAQPAAEDPEGDRDGQTLTFERDAEGNRTATWGESVSPRFEPRFEMSVDADGVGVARFEAPRALDPGVLALPSADRPTLAVAWTADAGGRVDATLAAGPVTGEAVTITECWDAAGRSVHRGVTPAAEGDPQFGRGDPSACPL